MATGLFILMYGDETLQLSLNYNWYGFLMPPVFEEQPSSQSRHYAVLSDYACCENETHIFFFSKRRIIYGGVIKGDSNSPLFYLNGNTSPLSRKANAKLYNDLSNIFPKYNNSEGVYAISNGDGSINGKAQPFIIEFEKVDGLTGKQITSDELYFELGKYGYPLPSNALQGRGLATLTPAETDILLNLLNKTDKQFKIQKLSKEPIIKNQNKTLFDINLIKNEQYINESHLEFLLLSNINLIESIIPEGNYSKCRQVPICPFKPMQFDRADICLYDSDNPINDGTIPNVLIELKTKNASFKEFEQVNRYLKWLEMITNEEDFERITPILIAPNFSRNLNIEILQERGIETKYFDKIKFFSLEQNKVI